MNKFIYLLLLSISLCQFIIKDGKAYDLSYDKYYSDQEFIDFLSSDSSFYNDTHLKKFKKSHRNLQLKRNWYIYLLSIGGIGSGVEGIRYPERWDEGGDNYDSENPDEKPPGFENVAIGVILYTSYFGYNKIRKDRSLPHIINKYNKLYLNEEIEDIQLPQGSISASKFWVSNTWDGSISMGFSSDKIPTSLIDISAIHNINKHSDFYGTLSTTILGGGLGVGYKYHILDKYMTTPFIGTSLFTYGDGCDVCIVEWRTVSGFSVYSGISLFRSNDNPFAAPIKKVKKYSINFGAHWTYVFGDGFYDLYPVPFLNVEIRN